MSETWVLNETISGILSQTNINFVSNQISFVAIIKSSNYLKYYIDENGSSSAMAYRNGSWTISAYRTITFDTAPTGDLLTWLQSNGTKQATEPTFSFTHRYKSDNLIGTGAYKFLPYTLTQQTTLISFTIDRSSIGSDTISYQAEEGMTWAQWVESSYNTGGYMNVGTKISDQNGNSVAIRSGKFPTNVSPSDTIQESTVYVLKASTGGGGK